MLFITEKRNGGMKEKKAAIGSKQRTYEGYDKRNGSSPTMNTDSVFLTGVLDAHEQRAAAILDI